MDKIQKVLIKAGRKDLAEEYYRKIAGSSLKFKDIMNIMHNSNSMSGKRTGLLNAIQAKTGANKIIGEYLENDGEITQSEHRKLLGIVDDFVKQIGSITENELEYLIHNF